MADSKERLVTRESLEELIEGVDELPQSYRLFMKKRWLGMVMWWHTRSVGARWKYFLLRAIIVVGGVTIPVLTTLSMRTGWQENATVAIAIVGAIVAGCAAWEGVANYGETWREKRRSAEMLKVEGWMFLQLCGKYQPDGTHEVAFPRFALEVETMVAKEVGEYLAVFNDSLAQSKKAADDVIGALADAVTKRIQANDGGLKPPQ